MSLNISYTASTNYDMIAIRGNMTITSMSSGLNKYINNEAQKDLILDLSEVKSIDSRGLSLVIELKNKTNECNKQLYILKPSEAVMKTLRETNMLKVLTIVDSSEVDRIFHC